ncbi:hypothetical protein [Pararhizobium sp. O133]|uniref:hypothetical protein n=1 Tax=Pararhizobium sp. O133 TaxID=3449278 RepID=UPI003F683764
MKNAAKTFGLILVGPVMCAVIIKAIVDGNLGGRNPVNWETQPLFFTVKTSIIGFVALMLLIVSIQTLRQLVRDYWR